jgi:alkanesulfonate monooxygenase SsuD/methylene tetrahydromethanopterin reductase-like flavin-dependent oxidoreductase (luciferase family)
MVSRLVKICFRKLVAVEVILRRNEARRRHQRRDIPAEVERLTRRVAEDVKTAYKLERDKHTEARLAQLIPDELVPRFAFAGSPEVTKEQIDALRGLGVDEVIRAIPPEGQAASRDDCDLMPLFTASAHRRGCPDLRIAKGRAA